MTADPTTPTGDAAISEILAWLRREAHGHTMAHEERHMSDIEVYRSQERAHRYRQAADVIERLTRATPPQPDAALRELVAAQKACDEIIERTADVTGDELRAAHERVAKAWEAAYAVAAPPPAGPAVETWEPKPCAWRVPCPPRHECDALFFWEETDAQDQAVVFAEAHDLPEGVEWPVHPLYAKAGMSWDVPPEAAALERGEGARS